jgi:phosphoribosylaminoimidazole-succinocarboxamide synthase
LLPDGRVVLIDEIHTPDSSRYFYAEGFQERQSRGEDQVQLSKEFVRQFLIAEGFQGKEGQSIPELTDEWALDVSKRYIHLYELLTGKTFDPASSENAEGRIIANVENYLKSIQV